MINRQARKRQQGWSVCRKGERGQAARSRREAGTTSRLQAVQIILTSPSASRANSRVNPRWLQGRRDSVAEVLTARFNARRDSFIVVIVGPPFPTICDVADRRSVVPPIINTNRMIETSLPEECSHA
jgi:hypothetical protein